jgi:hypothetical protein
MPDQGFQERRKYPRYPASLKVSLGLLTGRKQRFLDRRISGEGRNISGRTGDISFEGLLVKANPPHRNVSSLFLNDEKEIPIFVVDLEIELNGKMIRAEAEMRWFKLWYTGQEPYQLETGVFLRKMESESRRLWDEYFKRFKS